MTVKELREFLADKGEEDDVVVTIQNPAYNINVSAKPPVVVEEPKEVLEGEVVK